MMEDRRIGTVSRKTKETDIFIKLNLDGDGTTEISTGIGFFDHMLNGMARHGFFDLKVAMTGDLEVDCHHSIEDAGIVLGTAIREAAGTSGVSAGSEAVFFPWMRRWCSALWIFRGGPYLSLTRFFPPSGSGIWTRRW